MKTAIYIEDGVIQLVLTPENKFETDALGSFSSSPLSVSIKEGQFYNCQGGWTRHQDTDYNGYLHTRDRDKSLILRMVSEKPEIT